MVETGAKVCAVQRPAASLANLIPWKRGQSGNPKGRITAGATVREWFNALCEKNLNADELRAIKADPKQPWARQAAANQMLRALEDSLDLDRVIGHTDGSMVHRSELKADIENRTTIDALVIRLVAAGVDKSIWPMGCYRAREAQA